MRLVDLLIVLAADHVGEVQQAGVMGEGELVPDALVGLADALAVAHDVAEQLGGAAALAADGLGEGLGVAQVGRFRVRLEGEQVEHGDCAAHGQARRVVGRAEPGAERVGEGEVLRGRFEEGVVEGAG